MSNLSSLSGAPLPGRRAAVDTGGGAPLSSLSGAPSLGGGKPRAVFNDDDDDDFLGLKPGGAKTSSGAKGGSSSSSNVRKSTPNPTTMKFDDDDDMFPKSNTKKTVSFAPDKKGAARSKSPFGDDDDDDFRQPSKPVVRDPFADDKPSGRTAAGASSRPSASNPAFKWDDDSPPRTTAGSGKPSKGLFDDDDNDFMSSLNPDSVFSGKKADEQPRPAGFGGRAAGTRPTGPKADDIFGMMKEEPPPIGGDLSLDLFGGSASKPAPGPRAGRRAAAQALSGSGGPELSPEASREPTPEPARPMTTGDIDTGSTGLMGRRRGAADPGPSQATLAAEVQPPVAVGRAGRGISGDGGGAGPAGLDLDGDDLPGLGSPALGSKAGSTSSFYSPGSAAAGGVAIGRRAATAPASAAAVPPGGRAMKRQDSWETDDNLLPDESNTAPVPSPAPALAPPAPSVSPTPSSGYTPSAEAPGRSRLQHTTYGGTNKDDNSGDEAEPSTGGYMPSFGGRRPGSGLGGFGGGLATATSDPLGPGSAMTPGGPGAPRPRRQMGGGTESAPMSPMAVGRPGALPSSTATGKKTKEEEERERVAAAMAAAQARRQQLLAQSATGPIRFPGQGPVAMSATEPGASQPSGAGRAPGGAGEGMSTGGSPMSRPGGGIQSQGARQSRPPVDLGLSSSSDDDLPRPHKATSPAVPTPNARKPGATPVEGNTSAPEPLRGAQQQLHPVSAGPRDARVTSSVPEMASGPGRVDAEPSGSGIGAMDSIPQPRAPSPLHMEASYPASVTSQPSAVSVGAAMPAPHQERSGMSAASAVSVASGSAVAPTQGSHSYPATTATGQPEGMQAAGTAFSGQAGFPLGATTLQGAPGGLPPGVTAMGPGQAGLPPGVTVMGGQAGLPPGVTAMGGQSGLPPGVTTMQGQTGLPPGVTVMSGQAGLPPGVTSMSSHASLPPGVLAMGGQAGLPPGVTLMGGQAGLPPGVTSMGGQAGLPPGVTAMGGQAGVSFGSMAVNTHTGLPPGVVAMGAAPQYGGSSLPQGLQSSFHEGQGLSAEPSQIQMGNRGTPPLAPSSSSMPPTTSQDSRYPNRPAASSQPSFAASGSAAAAHSHGEITVASLQMDSLKESIKDTLVQNLQENLEKVSSQMSDIKAVYDQQLEDVRKQRDRQADESRAAADKALAEVKAEAAKQLEEGRTQTERHLAEARAQAQREAAEARLQAERAAMEARSQAERASTEALAQAERRAEEARLRHEAQIAALRTAHEKAAAEARATCEKQLADARASREKALEDARVQQARALEDARLQGQKSLGDVRALHDKVLADSQAIHIKQLLELKAAHEAEMRRAAEDIHRTVEDTRRLAEEARRQEAETRRAKDESAALRDRIIMLEADLRARDIVVREGENRISQLDARSKMELAEAQASAIKEAALLQLELEDAKASLQRVRHQYDEAAAAHAAEAARYRAELDAARQMAEEELQRTRTAAAEQVAAAEARGRRAGSLDKEIAEASIRQQMAAIAEEKEVVSRHRLSAELLAQLTDKVRSVAVGSIEREERALSALERDVADRESRLAAREKLLAEREGRVAAREKEVDALRADLQNLMVTLENSAVHDREDLKREQLRLSREAARVEAAASSLQAERDDLRLQIATERQLLEEAREARRREREELLSEVSTERRRLATEYADTQRQLDAARNELLALRSRLVDLESRRGSAMTQADEEKHRLEALQTETAALRENINAESAQVREVLRAETTATREALAAEVAATRDALHAEVADAREALRAEAEAAHEEMETDREAMAAHKASVDGEARQMLDFASKLKIQSAELAARVAESDTQREQLAAAQTALAAEQAALAAAQAALEEQRRVLSEVKKALDRERLAVAEDRRGLSEERLAASRAAEEARAGQLQLAEAVRAYVMQGVPIPYFMDGGTGALKPLPAGAAPAFPTAAPDKQQSGKRRGSKGQHGGGHRSRNALRHMLDKLGLDASGAGLGPGAGGGEGGNAYLRAQQEFLEKARLSSPHGVMGVLMSAGPKLPGYTRLAPSSPLPPGLDPELLPPTLKAAAARSAAVTPIKHAPHAASKLSLDSERPSPMGLPDGANAADPGPGHNSDLNDLGYMPASAYLGQGALWRQDRTADGPQAAGPEGSHGGSGPGGNADVIQQLLNTIQHALNQTGRVGQTGAPPQDPAAGAAVGGMQRAGLGSAQLSFESAVPYITPRGDPVGSRGTAQANEDGSPENGAAMSEIASLLPLSSSSSSLDLDSTDQHTGRGGARGGGTGRRSGVAAALGPRLEALSGELSGGGLAFSLGQASPGQDAGLGQQQQQRLGVLGELSAVSDMLSARLGELGLGSAAEGRSLASSAAYSPAGALPTPSGGAALGARRPLWAGPSAAQGPADAAARLGRSGSGHGGGDGLLNSSARSADVPLLGSANIDALGAGPLALQGSTAMRGAAGSTADDAVGGLSDQGSAAGITVVGERTLSPIASLASISEDDDDDEHAAMLP